MTTVNLVALFIVWIAAITSPGPDLLQVIRQGSRSRKDGIWTAAGIVLGTTIWITASLFGLSALISATPALLFTLQVVGGTYLTWMGFGAIRSWWGQRASQQALSEARSVDRAMESLQDAEPIGVWPALRAGLATNLSNPKAVLFFGSVFAQFIRPDMGIGWSIFIAVFLIATGAAWFFIFAALVRTFAAKITRNGAVIDLVSGVIFMALGIFMVWQGAVGIGSQVLS